MSRETIFNPDGSVYMTFPPAVPSTGDLEGWTVRQVCNVHRTPGGAEFRGQFGWVVTEWKPGTVSLVTSDCESFNGVLRIVGELSAAYGYRPPSCKITADTFRWTWERWTPDGTHMSDMIIASKIH